ncbi:TSUP family transporter, partial [Vibrio sp. Vb0932]|uniref:TSUP family transporter n=1 Tax=Vibrio sp. Vb0932 TaxID=3074633 RepID=UPI00398E7D4C
MELTLEVLTALFLVASVAGFIDAMAGGGGLLTLPALLAAGLSPTQALATNKLQG